MYVYLDCREGITPGKLFGALIDLGIDLHLVKKEMKKMPFLFNLIIEGIKQSDGKNKIGERLEKGDRGKVKLKEECKGGVRIKGKRVEVKTQKGKMPVQYKEIVNLIESTPLKANVKDRLRKVYEEIGKAEAKVHQEPLEEVHLHEVAQPKAILTAVGIIAALEQIKAEKIYCSPLGLGRGKVKCSHGILSVPTPATRQLMAGLPKNSSPSPIKGELTTPLGVAIVRTLVDEFGEMLSLKIKKRGYGAGNCTGPEGPDILGIYLGEH